MRRAKKLIFAKSPPRILIAGRLDKGLPLSEGAKLLAIMRYSVNSLFYYSLKQNEYEAVTKLSLNI